MALLTVEGLSKSYGMKNLFKKIDVYIEANDSIGVVGINGTGKSTLLKIIGGYESADEGGIIKSKTTTIEYLSQAPIFEADATVIEQVLKGDSEIFKLLRRYELAVEDAQESPEDKVLQDKLMVLSEEMTLQDGWELESQVKTILTKLKISDFHKPVGELSGGQKKRVALASSLLSTCDLLILDEPTNHLDSDTIAWLESYLQRRKGALLMVTHDRYFLDRVCNKIVELFHGSAYTYDGNYTAYVTAKAERMALNSVLERKTQNLYKQELAWIRTGAKARSTKQKARIQRFEALKEQSFITGQDSVDITVGFTRMGKKTIILDQLGKSFGDIHLFDQVSYTFLPTDRIGIVGKNGAGKTTMLNIMTDKLQPSSGSIEIGDTIKIGYFSQEADDMDTSLRCIDYIKETAEYIATEDGLHLTASQMMERFLIGGEMQYAPIHSLSGGEKRRLYLLKVLMEAPNVLILDEPTNDLDIDTLKVLESYIDVFKGIVVTVSHDRYFLDRTCNKLMVFNGQSVEIFHGSFEDYRETIEQTLKEQAVSIKPKVKKDETKAEVPEKLTYKEQQDFKTIDEEVEALMEKLDTLTESMASHQSEYTKLQAIGDEIEETELELMEKMEYQELLEQKNKAFLDYKKA